MMQLDRHCGYLNLLSQPVGFQGKIAIRDVVEASSMHQPDQGYTVYPVTRTLWTAYMRQDGDTASLQCLYWVRENVVAAPRGREQEPLIIDTQIKYPSTEQSRESSALCPVWRQINVTQHL